MNGQRTIVEIPATSEQILSVLQDYQRLECGEVPENQVLSFDWTVDNWIVALEIFDAREYLSRIFGLAISKAEWATIDYLGSKTSLRQLCDFLARRALLPQIKEQIILGGSCKIGSAFLGLRWSLQKAGLDMTGVRPSTKLNPVLCRDAQRIADVLTKLTPGRTLRISGKRNILFRLSGWAFFICLILGIGFGISGNYSAMSVYAFGLVISFCGVLIFSRFPLEEAHIEGCETFGDLSRLIANPQDRSAVS